MREVVGIGGKDGTYYVIDRDGVNEINGVRWDDPLEVRNPRPENWCTLETQNIGLPYWCRRVVEGGVLGGIIASAAVGEGRIFFSTAPGRSITDPQLPAAWALHMSDGSVAWSNAEARPSFAPTGAVPGVVFMGTTFLSTKHGFLDAYATADGARLIQLDVKSLPGGASSVPAVVGGMVFVGGGVGVFGRPGGQSYLSGSVDTPISAFCLRGAPGCTDDPPCDDGNPCTYDYRRPQGTCTSEPAPNTLSCNVNLLAGTCLDGACVPMPTGLATQ
ncbi:MAG: hypothetical protein A3J75_04525 [Acidobacteria bacterium RBG_16_68_9]|nr:MAG: hypothetical protein A3J75_04525 [Acidobacteria bacterium RBG_16_68_9]